MSTTIDQRVVEMRFDNKNFENNVQQSMSTLDKLKQKLNLKGASKGLENLNTSANKVNMNGLCSALDVVHSKFSAMEIVGITALANITNSAVNAGKRMVAALTIDPIKTGLKEYETQIDAVQTILANTQKEGTNVEIVNKALDELNEYADKTIYNFTEMTRNIGTFTAAGVKLDTSVKAIKGISNLAAVSGSTSQQASTAMYQLSQALSSGTVKLMDWNSVVNAGMGGQVFQDALKETARVHGVAIDKMIEQEGSFRNTLQKGWLSSEILTETLEKFTYSAEEGSEAWNEYKKSLMDKGYTEQQATEILKLGNTATEAATKVKTFSQLWSVLKEAAQSGWAQTWRIIIGDFEEAKALFTPLANFFTGPNGIITKMSNARNKLLEGALSHNPFTAMIDKLENSGVGKIAKKVSGISKSLEEYQNIVNKVWRGDYNNRGDNPDRFDLLEKDGWNPHVVQSLVNKGNEYKLTVEDIAEAEKKHGITAKESVEAVTELSDAQLKNAGFTEDEIRMYRQLEEQSKKTGKSIEEIINEMEKKDGRTLLIESLANVGKGIVAVFKSIGEAWRDAFPPMTSLQLYNIIDGLHSFSEKLVMSKDTSEKLTRTLKGVFAILDLISMVIGGGFKIAFTVLKAVLGAFNLDILEFTAIIGDAIVKFRNWIEEHNYLAIGITKVVTLLIKMGKAVANLAKRLWELPAVQKFVEPIINAFKKLDDITLDDITSALKSFGKAIKNAFSNINKHFNGVPGDIISGLANGFKDGVTKVITTVVNLAKTIINKFKEILGIHSPSTVFFAIGGFIIAGLIGGLLSGSTDLGSAASGIVDNLKEFFGNIDWSKIFTAGMSAGILLAVKSILDSIRNISGFFGGLGSMFGGVGEVLHESADGIGKILDNTAKVVKNFAKIMSAIAFKKATEGIKNLAVSVLIIAAAVALLTKIDQNKMWQAVGAIAALAVILGVLSAAIAFMSKSSMSISKNGIQVSGVKSALFSIAAAILAMGLVVKLIGGLSPEQVEQGMEGLTKVILMMGGLLLAFGLFVKGDAAQNMDKAGKMIRKIGTTLLLMVLAVKLISLLKKPEIDKGTEFIGGFVVFVGLLALISNFAGNDIDKVGKAISKISWALLLMIAVVKLAGSLSQGELTNGAIFAAGFVVFVGALVKVTKIGNDQQIAKVGGLILSISAAMLIMVALVKIISGMDFWAFVGGAAGVALLGLLIVGLLYLVKLAGKDAPKLAGTILALSVAIGILAAIAIVLSLIKFDTFMNGAKCVGVLAIIIGALLLCSKGAGDAQKTAMSIAIAIGVMAAAIGILSFIKPEKLIAPTIAMAALMGMFALILKSSKNVTGSMGCLIVMTAAIGVIALALGLLAKLPIENTIGAAISLSLLIGALVGVMLLINKMKPSVGLALKGAIGLLALCVPLAALALTLRLMKGVDNAVSSVVALSLLMSVMTVLLVIISKISINLATALPGILGLLALCIPLVALVGILYLMKGVSNAIESANALSKLLIVMTVVLIGLSVVGALGPAAFIGIGALATLIVGLGALIIGIGALVDKFPMLEEFLNKGIPILEKIGYALGSFFGNIIGGALAGITDGLPEIGTNLSKFMLNLTPFIVGAKMIDTKAMEGVKALAETVLILTAANILDGISKLLGADNSLADFGNEIASFGPCLQKFAEATKGINTDDVKNAAEATKALVEVADAVPNSGGLLAKITGDNDLSDFGDEIDSFGGSLVDFADSISELDAKDIENIKNSAIAAQEMIKIAKEVPNSGGLVSMITGDNSLADFGDEMEDFGDELAEYGENIEGIDPDLIKKSATASKELINMAKSFDGGLIEKVTGEKNLGSFAANLVTFGKNLVTYGNTVQGLNTESIETSVGAAKGIVELANTLNPENGWLQKITGQKLNLGGFGKTLVPFGESLKAYGESVVGLNTESISIATRASSEIIRLATMLNNSHSFKGDNGFVSFVKNLIPFGTNLKLYSTVVQGLNTESILLSAKAAGYVVSIANKIPNSGGFLSKLAGESSLTSFASQLVPFGKSLKNYSKAVTDLNAEPIKNSANAAKYLVDVVKIIPKKEGFFASLFGKKTDINFPEKLVPLAVSIKEYASKASNINTKAITESETALRAMVRILGFLNKVDASNIENVNNAINSLNGINFNGLIKSFGATSSKFKLVGSNIMDNLIKGFQSKQSNLTTTSNNILKKTMTIMTSFRGRFKNVGNLLMQFMAIGIKTGAKNVSSAMKTSLLAATISIRSNYSSFYSAGSYVVSGFVSGINNNAYKAKNAAKYMAKAALKAAKETLGIASPSKEFYKAGDFAGIGFTNALTDNISNSYDAGYSLAESARKGLSKAISKVADAINSDMDMQPTIRPVLDLTDVRNSANYLNTMFNNGPSIDVMSNLNAISSGMDTMNQNGVNRDVVSAINDLRKDIGNVGGDTYNVNGITYDDGSNITDAVKTLVRAAKIERRI